MRLVSDCESQDAIKCLLETLGWLTKTQSILIELFMLGCLHYNFFDSRNLLSSKSTMRYSFSIPQDNSIKLNKSSKNIKWFFSTKLPFIWLIF